MNSCIYSITNAQNGKRYIGSTSDVSARWKNHRNTLRRGKHHCSHLQNAYNKWGPDAFEYEVLMHCSEDAKHSLEEMAFSIFNHSGLYNTKSSACGGSHRKGAKHTEVAKAKLREAALKQDKSEHKRAMAEWQANRSPEMEAERRRKISERMKQIRAAQREGQLIPPAKENGNVTSLASGESGPASSATDVLIKSTINK